MRTLAFILSAVLLLGCSAIANPDRFTFGDADAGRDAGGGVVDAGADAGGRDAGPPRDAGSDAGVECQENDTRPCPGGISTGECDPGVETCTNGTWGACMGAIGPTSEACDGDDNDCDGIIDGLAANAACMSGQVCSAGRCVVTMCPAGRDDCNMMAGDGCEADLATDRMNCGSCGTACAWDCAGSCNDAIQVAVGGTHTCALRRSGEVVCWGANDRGQLGRGSFMPSQTPVAVVGVGGVGTLSNVTQISASSTNTCARRSDATVVCWGDNLQGQLTGVAGDQRSNTPVEVATSGGVLGGVTSVEAGVGYTCAVMSDTSVRCWGRESFLGIGSGGMPTRPISIRDQAGTSILTGVESIALGADHMCARMSDRTVQCWGANGEGQLGNGGTTGNTQRPTPVPGLANVEVITAGGAHSCALLTGGEVRCWGDNLNGALGIGTTMDQDSPQPVTDLAGLTVVGLSTRGSVNCARSMDGTGRCWGFNGFGGVGDQTTTTPRSSPVQVIGLAGAVELHAGNHSCARLGTGEVVCWGAGTDGQIGNNTMADQPMVSTVLAP